MAKSTELKLTFTDSTHKKKVISLTCSSADLDQETIKAAMQDISDAGVFVSDKTGVELYKEPYSAKYVEKNITDVFSIEDVDEGTDAA